MNETEVRIVKLEPMRVASVQGFGKSPEYEAMEKLKAWAEPKGMFDHPTRHRIFGFNNPNPSPGSPHYGYEFWIEVGPDIQPEGEVTIQDFAGGLYAVLNCEVKEDPPQAIPETWKRLVQWLGESKYQHATHQWLEEHLTLPDAQSNVFELDLYMPITE